MCVEIAMNGFRFSQNTSNASKSMNKFSKLALLVSAIFVSFSTHLSAAEDIDGTYEIDFQDFVDLAMYGAEMEFNKMPEITPEMKTMMMTQARTAIEGMKDSIKIEVTLHSGGKFDMAMDIPMAGMSMTAKGTYELNGEKLNLVTTHQGENVLPEPVSEMHSYTDGVIHLNAPGMPKPMKLNKKQ